MLDNAAYMQLCFSPFFSLHLKPCFGLFCPASDTFIQKTKQRYNSPRSLSTRIDLADMQTEIKLRPPYQLSPEDLRAINGFSVVMPTKYKGIGTVEQHLVPHTAYITGPPIRNLFV